MRDNVIDWVAMERFLEGDDAVALTPQELTLATRFLIAVHKSYQASQAALSRYARLDKVPPTTTTP
jgi:hypothetical protein